LIVSVAVAVAALVCAAVPYFFVERRWRWRWREIETGRMPGFTGDTGVYRELPSVPRYGDRAPRLVRAAAFTCFLFGQMFVPGLIVGAYGLVMCGVGVVAVPGLITAAKLYGAGLALLRREPRRSYFDARNAAAWALWLNAVLFVLSLAPMIFTPSFAAVFVTLNGYGLASVAQALLLRRAARVHEDALFAPTSTVRIAGMWCRTRSQRE
jgi:hypothetical protein